jgi:D-isomer specific 2-hydroxyacid dehydrogenase, catalytic domain
MSRGRVLVTTDYLHPGDDVHTLLRKRGHQVNYRPAVGPRDPDETLALFDGVHGAIVASEPITAEMLDHAPGLKVLAQRRRLRLDRRSRSRRPRIQD